MKEKQDEEQGACKQSHYQMVGLFYHTGKMVQEIEVQLC